MLTLSGFEAQIPPTILERGKQYFANGNVTELEEADNKWEATVEGSDTYLVEITIGGSDDITDSFCDCPYDGDVCKHVAAVLFALQKKMNTQKKEPKKAAGKDVFANLLQTVSAKEFQDFIREYAARNKKFKIEFELFFAEKDSRIDVEKKYSDILQKLIKKYTSGDYINYRDSLNLSREINKLLAAGNTYLSKNNFKDAFALAKAILTTLFQNIERVDDSGGNLGDNLDKAIDFFKMISESRDAAIRIKEQVYDFLQTKLTKEKYFHYDFGYSLFDIFRSLAVLLNKEDNFISFINDELPKLSRAHKTSQKEYYQTSVIAFLQQTGKTKEAEDLIQQSLYIVEVRQAQVNKAVAKKDFTEAKHLIQDGIRIAENNNSKGDTIHWQQQTLQIAMSENEVDVIRQYAKQFAFYHGFYQAYYRQWKATYLPADWKPVIEKWIADTIYKVTAEWNNIRFWRPAQPPLLEALAPVYIEEGMTDRLLLLVQQKNDLTATMEYQNILVKTYPEELLAIYLPALEAFGLKADNRTQYADFVNKMKRIMADIPAGKERILSLAQTFKELYSSKPRRPAMIEELNKILL